MKVDLADTAFVNRDGHDIPVETYAVLRQSSLQILVRVPEGENVLRILQSGSPILSLEGIGSSGRIAVVVTDLPD